MKNAKGMQTNSKVTEYYSNSTSSINAELNTVALIARRNVLLDVLYGLLDSHTQACGKRFKDYTRWTCGRTKTTTYLLTECLAVNAHETLKSSKTPKVSPFSMTKHQT